MASLPDSIQAGAIELCRNRPETVDDVLEAVESSYPELHHWLSWAQIEPTREWLLGVLEEDQVNFEADDHWAFTLREPERGKVAGCAALHTDQEVGTLVIGYWVRTVHTGRGYASAAVRALTDAAFKLLPRLSGYVSTWTKPIPPAWQWPAGLATNLLMKSTVTSWRPDTRAEVSCGNKSIDDGSSEPPHENDCRGCRGSHRQRKHFQDDNRF